MDLSPVPGDFISVMSVTFEVMLKGEHRTSQVLCLHDNILGVNLM